MGIALKSWSWWSLWDPFIWEYSVILLPVIQEEAEIFLNIYFSTAGIEGSDRLEDAEWQAPGLPGMITPLLLSISQLCPPGDRGYTRPCDLRVCCSHEWLLYYHTVLNGKAQWSKLTSLSTLSLRSLNLPEDCLENSLLYRMLVIFTLAL